MMWLCVLQHRWTEWGPVVKVTSQRIVFSGGQWTASPTFEKDSQERSCFRCKAMDRRQVPYKDDPNP